MSSDIDEALRSPFKKAKDVDREVEYLSTEELVKKKLLLSNKKRPLFQQVTVSRCREL